MTSVGNVTVDVRLARTQLLNDIKEMQRQLDNLRGSVDIDTKDANSGLNDLNNNASALKASLGTLAAVAATALTIVASVAKEAAIAFDSAKVKASTLTNDANGLAASMRGLSKDLDHQVGSVALLDASYDVLSSGYSKTADVTNILKASTNAAIGGFSNIGTVSDTVTTILNSYGKSASEAAKITDVLVATQNAGKITVAQYAGLIGQAASVASAAGVSFEEYSAFVAGATAKGVEASSAVTGIRAAITAILSPTDVASKLAKDLGVQFSATALKSKGLSGILADLNAKGAATPQVLTELFGSVEAVAAIMPSAGQNVEFFNKNLAYIQNSAGMAQQAAEKVSNSFEGQIKKAANEANEALISLGQGALAIAQPFAIATTALLEGFNSLPEPVKQTVGAVIQLTAAAAALGGGLVAVNVVTPLVKAGLAELAIASGAASAATAANAAITNASTLASTIFSAQINISNAALVINAVQAKAAAIGTALYAAATGTAATGTAALAATLASLAVKAALVAAAVYAVSEAFKRSEGAKFASLVDENTRKVLEFKASIEKTDTTLKESAKSSQVAARGFQLIGKAFSEGGGVEAARTALAELDRAIGGTSDATSAYGEELGFTTAKQRGAQLAMIALDSQLDEVGKEFNRTQEIMAKYGVVTVDAADKQRLGAEGIKKFKDEAAQQIKVLDQWIDSLKSQKAPTEDQQRLINENVKNLETQKAALRQRALALDSDANSMKNNSKVAKELLIDIDALNKAYGQDIAKSGLKIDTAKANVLEQESKGNVGEDERKTKITTIERQGLEERLNIAKEYLPKLQAAKIGAKPEEIEKINNQIQENEKQSAQLRAEIAKNLTDQKKQDNEKAVNDEKSIATRASQKIVGIEQDRALLIARSRLSGRISSEEADRLGAVSVQSKVQLEIKSEEERLARYKALRQRGAITAKEYADVEGEITINLKKLKVSEAESELKVKESTLKKELALFEEANNKKQIAQEKSAQNTILAAKKQQLGGKIDKDDVSSVVAQTEKQAIKNNLALADAELKKIAQLEQQKLLTKEEYAKRRSSIELNISRLTVDLVDKEIQIREQANAKIISDFERMIKQKEALIEKEKTANVINVKTRQLNGAIDTDAADKELAAGDSEATKKKIASASSELAKVSELEKRKVLTTKEAADRRQEIEQKLGGLKIQYLDQQLQARDRANKEELDGIAKTDKLAENQIRNSADKRLVEIRRSVQAGTKLQEVAAVEQAQIARQSTEQQIGVLNKQLAKIEDLEKRKVITAKEAANRRQEIEQELTSKNIELANRLIDQAEKVKEAQIRAIQDRADASKQVFDDEILRIEKEKSARADLLKLLDQDKQLLESRLSVKDTASTEAQAQAGAESNKFDRALSARQKLDSSKDLGKYTQQALQDQLARNGFSDSTGESKILAQKIQAEEQLAKLQEAARKSSQDAARTLLEVEIHRNRIVAETLKLEAEIASSKASSARIQAEANLEKANISGDKRAIATATADLKIATSQEEAAKKQIGFAERGIKALGEMETNSRKALDQSQKAADIQAKAAEQNRKEKSALDLAEAKDKDVKTGRAVSNYDPFSGNGSVKPGKTAGQELADIGSTYGTPGYKAPTPTAASSAIGAQPSIQPVNPDAANGLNDLKLIIKQMQDRANTKPDPQMQSQTSSKVDNAQLEKLTTKIEAIASRPSTINVTTANPVSDAARIYNDLAKTASKGANL